MDLFIDEVLLNDFIKATDFEGELEHRGLNAILKQFAMLGYLHRGEHKVIFHNSRGDETVYAGIDEDYDEYLDKKASQIETLAWEEMNHD